MELGISDKDVKTRDLVMPLWAEFTEDDLHKFITDLSNLPSEFRDQGENIIQKLKTHAKKNIIQKKVLKNSISTCRKAL